MDGLPTVKEPVDASAIDAIEHMLPARRMKYRLARRVAGLGSLGHLRYVAIADWNGGQDRSGSESAGRIRMSVGQGARSIVRNPLPDDREPCGPLSRSLCTTARPVDSSPTQSSLLSP